MPRAWTLLIVVGVAGACGRVGFERRGAATSDGAVADAATTIDGAASSDGAVADGATTIDGAVADGAPPSCDVRYTFVVGASRYRLAVNDSWLNSEVDCASDGAGHHLVVIDDAAEMAALVPLAGTAASWVGISARVTPGAFHTVTGVAPPPFLPWSPGAPSLATASCVSWDPASGKLTDVNCGVNRNRVCECDGLPANSN
jgi:hypothetical protein